ncbi:MAG: hypothetical protein D3M94_09780 [Rhodocyclales bacterium GT-UBC]|nr:MAG: hypothetical protein D3M94_09780 [Rhodocyclales bacterium GT-UBC]
MSRELITSWSEYQLAFERILAMATQKVAIYDANLKLYKLDSPPQQLQIKRILLLGGHTSRLRIALRATDEVYRETPRLINLLNTYGHVFAMQQTAPELSHLRDAMIIVDDQHALIRFEQNLPRSKLLINENDEVRPYGARFDEIWDQGGDMIHANVLGL